MKINRKKASGSKTSLADLAYGRIIDKIHSGEWPPGYLLNRRELAETFGISPAPVLEAIVRLVTEGTLETLPRKGTRVRLLTPDEFKGQMIVREALECQAARMICGKKIIARTEELAKFAEIIDSKGEKCDDPFNLYTLEIQFHRQLIEVAGCPALTDAYNRVVRISHFLQRVLTASDRGRGYHEILLRELSTEDPDEAETAMRRHLHP